MAANRLNSYLSNRKQFVYRCINGINSDYQEVSCKVPQGSALGPQLFILCVMIFVIYPIF